MNQTKNPAQWTGFEKINSIETFKD